MIRIWGRTNSVNVKKVLWCLDELGLEYERTDAGMQHGVVNTPEYRQMNPNGLVPTAASGQAPMVNWDIVTSDFHAFATSVQNTTSDLEKRISKHTS